jgi:hypothetical protein
MRRIGFYVDAMPSVFVKKPRDGALVGVSGARINIEASAQVTESPP